MLILSVRNGNHSVGATDHLTLIRVRVLYLFMVAWMTSYVHCTDEARTFLSSVEYLFFLCCFRRCEEFIIH